MDMTLNAAWTKDCPHFAMDNGDSGYLCKCFGHKVACFEDVQNDGTQCKLCKCADKENILFTQIVIYIISQMIQRNSCPLYL